METFKKKFQDTLGKLQTDLTAVGLGAESPALQAITNTLGSAEQIPPTTPDEIAAAAPEEEPTDADAAADDEVAAQQQAADDEAGARDAEAQAGADDDAAAADAAAADAERQQADDAEAAAADDPGAEEPPAEEGPIRPEVAYDEWKSQNQIQGATVAQFQEFFKTLPVYKDNRNFRWSKLKSWNLMPPSLNSKVPGDVLTQVFAELKTKFSKYFM